MWILFNISGKLEVKIYFLIKLFFLIHITDAKKFKDAVVECQDKIDVSTDEQESNKLAKELEGLKVKESNEENENEMENKDSKTSSKDGGQKESETTETAASEEVKEALTSEDAPEK